MQCAIHAGEMYASAQFHANVARFSEATKAVDWLLTIVRKHPPPSREMNASMVAAISTYQVDKLIPDAYGKREGWDKMMFADLIKYLYVTRDNVDNTTIVTQALSNYVCGICKVGRVSRDWQCSQLAQIRRETNNANLEMELRVLEIVYDFYGKTY